VFLFLFVISDLMYVRFTSLVSEKNAPNLLHVGAPRK
jgi:hypothetical protein